MGTGSGHPAFSRNMNDTTTVINIASFYDIFKMQDKDYLAAFTAEPVSGPDKIPDLPFRNTGLSENINTAFVYIKFELFNPADSAEFLCFYPGYYFKAVHIFTEEESGTAAMLKTLQDSIPPISAGKGYRVIYLPPHALVKIYAELQPVRIKANKLSPELIRIPFLHTHLTLMHEHNRSLGIVTYILVGILCMMVLFALANYILSRKEEYLYYCLYATLTGFLLFAKTYFYHSAGDFIYFFEEYLDFIIILTAAICYVTFVRYFLNTGNVYPVLDKILKLIEAAYIGFIVIYSAIYFFTPGVKWLDTFENGIKILILTGALLFVILGFREKSVLVNYLAFGNLAMLTFGMVSLLIIIFGNTSGNIWGAALLYYDLAVVSELACFLFGLTYKGRIELIERIKIEDARNMEENKKDFEKQLAVIQAQQEERNRISTDMHDELGGGMTAIRLMSELAKQRMRNIHIPEIERISSSANDLLSKMNAIIWSMSPGNDSLANLIAYIRSYAQDFFENTAIQCEIKTKENIPVIEMSGIKRRNIFLTVKEALNNIMKHAKATKVEIMVELNGHLRISVKDNGIGFNHERIKPFSNGLHNMEKRMKSIGGSFRLVNNPEGTLIVLETGV
jgi:signal transduction histidine kinase